MAFAESKDEDRTSCARSWRCWDQVSPLSFCIMTYADVSTKPTDIDIHDIGPSAKSSTTS